MTILEQQVFTWRNRAVRGIILDMDGTIAHTKELHADAWEEWRIQRGLPHDRDEYLLRYFGRSNIDVMRELYPDLAHDRNLIREIAMEKEYDYLELVKTKGVPPVDGVLELIDRAEARDIPMAVASSAPRDNVVAVLESFNLLDRIRVRFSMDDVEKAKPDPEIFLKAAAGLGIPPEDCIVWEDSIHGLDGARAAGCRTVGVATLHTPGELRPHCDLVITDFAEMLRREDWSGF